MPTYTDEADTPGIGLGYGNSSHSSDDEEPTEEETRTLVRVADKLPWSAWLVAVIELCERFAFYGLNGPFQNYMQNPATGSKLPGAIGCSPRPEQKHGTVVLTDLQDLVNLRRRL